MATIKIKQVDAFTTTPFQGNPAGVVIEADGLTETQMQLIAREMNVSETAFILSPSNKAADLRIRWFTPQTEVPLCGHATIASFHALTEEGKLGLNKEGVHTFRVETSSGILPVTVIREKNALPLIQFGLPVPRLQGIALDELELASILGISQEDIEHSLPYNQARRYLLFPIKHLTTLLQLQVDFKRLVQWSKAQGLDCVAVFTLETREPSSKVHLRFFTPALGIDEDPVTGSVQSPMAAYLFEQGIITTTNGFTSYIAEQGDAIGRPGRVRVTLEEKSGQITSIQIAGNAITVLDGVIKL
ncbi:MAG: PhzF family phenazine biosynthesis protein [candidate division KSB1 bacterium]|nr:PhzF family phenazine biosynthesis protein [candidate division KSB1 bacterium]